jgi:hypothetical protein
MHVGHAIGQLPARGVIARRDAREAVADVQDAVPIFQSNAAIDAELKQLDTV